MPVLAAPLGNSPASAFLCGSYRPSRKFFQAVGKRGQGGMGIPVTRECALHGCEALNSDIGSREKGVYFDVTAFFTPHSSVHKAATGEVRGFGSGSFIALLFPTYGGA